MLQFRTFLPGDVHYLMDIEMKACEFFESGADWMEYGEAGGDVVIATVNGEPVGFLAWREDPLGRVIDQVVVKPSWQGRGIGRSLVQHFARLSTRPLVAFPTDPEWCKHLGFKEASYGIYILGA